MKAGKDIVALIELLRMTAEQWRHSDSDNLSESDLLCEDRSLLEMWPEACRRTGIAEREFPPGVLNLWKKRLGRAN